jgi:hypothetical protein
MLERRAGYLQRRVDALAADEARRGARIAVGAGEVVAAFQRLEERVDRLDEDRVLTKVDPPWPRALGAQAFHGAVRTQDPIPARSAARDEACALARLQAEERVLRVAHVEQPGGDEPLVALDAHRVAEIARLPGGGDRRLQELEG